MSGYPIWHPFTQHQTAQDPYLVTRAKDEFIYILRDGREIELIDGVSSWWVNIHGHCNSYINNRIREQLEKHEQVIFAGLTHEPAIQLIQGLQDLFKLQDYKFFFSDNGSTAIEVAIKMAIQYYYNQGEARNRILAFEYGYHGDTLGAMSSSGNPAFREAFKQLVFPVDFVSSPAINPEQTLLQIQTLFEQNPNQFACLILEPLVQGAGGMKFYPASVITAIHKLCQEHSVILIADEVFTGFGRTGSNLASEQASVQADIICLSKALTGGYLPMGLTAARNFIYEAFLSVDRYKTFFHGHSYTANSLACTAALASLELYKSKNRLKDVSRINQAAQEILKDIQDLPIVQDLRILGAITAIELDDRDGYFSNLGTRLSSKFLDHGIFLRPLGNLIYFLPPYIIGDESLRHCLATIKTVISEINDEVSRSNQFN